MSRQDRNTFVVLSGGDFIDVVVVVIEEVVVVGILQLRFVGLKAWCRWIMQ